MFLMPPSLGEWVEDGSLVKFVSDLVEALEEKGELSAFYARYREDGWGRAAYPPRMMVKVVLYGYCLGVRSSRKLAHALEADIGFRYLAANLGPDFRTLSDFRKEHGEALAGLFVKVLRLCQEAGLVKLGQVALDGRRVAGNARVERNRTQAKLEALAQQMLREAEQVDAAEDAKYGEDKRGDELPEALRTRAGRREAIDRALRELEEPQRQIREEHERKLEARRALEEKTGKRARGRRPKLKEDKIKRLQANLSDPESRLIKTRKGYVQGYNGQAMVDCSSQVIVAQDLRQDAVDYRLLAPMLKVCETQAGARPQVCLADGGYWSEANASLEDERTELYIAVGRSFEIEERTFKPKPRSRAVRKGSEAVRMREKLDTAYGRALYKLRSTSVEPVFGQMYERGLNRFLLRGLKKVATEWSLWCTSHNILKLWRSPRTCPG
jgi:transposase